MLQSPAIETFESHLTWRPNLLYIHGGVDGDRRKLDRTPLHPLEFIVHPSFHFESFSSMVYAAGVRMVYIDASASSSLADSLSRRGIPCVISWDEHAPPSCIPAMHFSHSFLAMLQNPTILASEAFALAVHLTRAFASHAAGPSALKEPPLPRIRAAWAPTLPSSSTVHPPSRYAVATDAQKQAPVPLAERIPGYKDVRLCAPHAEVRILLTALFGIMNATSLGNFCQALRGILVAEVRQISLVHVEKVEKPRLMLPSGCLAVRCRVRTPSGAETTVLMGAPENIVNEKDVLQHVVQQTIAADAQAMQMKLPPPGVPLPTVRNSNAIGHHAPLVEVLAVTSVWTVSLLRSMAKDASNRTLVASGIAAISGTPVSGFSPLDGNRFQVVVTMNEPARLLTTPPVATQSMLNGAAIDPVAVSLLMEQQQRGTTKPSTTYTRIEMAMPSSSARGRGLSMDDGLPPPPSTAAVAPQHAATPRIMSRSSEEEPSADKAGMGEMALASQAKTDPWFSQRRPLSECTEEDFLTDLMAFLQDRQGKSFEVESFSFPVIQEGKQLDLFSLYKTVVGGGGYRQAGGDQGLNWTTDVFPALQNSQEGPIPGIGNVLKRHYQFLLLSYEDANAWRDQRKSAGSEEAIEDERRTG